ncbi:hypothetical protein LINPERPRIM_LOCUS32380 [Linum perenne]
MGRSCLLRSFAPLILVLLILLPSCYSNGFGIRKMASGFGRVVFKVDDDSVVGLEENPRELSEESIDYQLDPEPNTNPRNGFVYPPPTDAPPPVPDW